MIEPIEPGIVEALGRPGAHPHDAGAGRGVEQIQTHLSHVFLTADRVYKLRKAVELPFVHFGTRAQRNQDCLREVALNRRLAPDVYLGVAPIEAARGGWRIGALGESLAASDATGKAPEHCVILRRLPAGRDALSLLEAGQLGTPQLNAVARRLAGFHARVGLGAPAPWEPAAWRERVQRPVENNFRAMKPLDWPAEGRARIARLPSLARRWFARRADCFEARRAAGRAVDGHGDVHLQHVWFEGEADEPLLIDCLEFNEGLRRIDSAAEVAFLAMDLEYREHPELAEHFLRAYARERDDFGLYAVVDYYQSYRAAVRAKVAGLAAADPEISDAQRAAAAASALRHLRLAERMLEREGPGALAILCGVVGSGKSTVAEALAEETGGAIVSSDHTRKRLAGLAPPQSAAADDFAGLYTKERSDEVYAGLLARAAPVLESGRVAVLDASFSRRERRSQVRRWAEDHGVPVMLLEIRCAPEVAIERLTRRAARGPGPSDAGPSFYATSVDTFEAAEEWPSEARRVVTTDASGWREAVREAAERLRPDAGDGGRERIA